MTTVKKTVKDAINTADLEIRVGRLEGTMEALAEEVKQTNHNLQNFARDTNQNINQLAVQVSHIKDTLVKEIGDVKDAFSCQLTQSSKPDWGIILSVIGLLTTVVVMGATLIAFMFSGQAEQIKINTDAVGVLQETDLKYNYEHGQTMQWIQSTEDKIAKLDLLMNDRWNRENELLETLRLWKIEHIEEHADFREDIGKISSDIEFLKKGYFEKNK